MDTRQKLDLSSPVVQRVFRLRERIARQNADLAGGAEALAATVQTQKGYQWQMWQKSDFSAYEGDGTAHVCK